MPTEAEPFHMPTPAHTTAWRSHLWISHALVIRDGKELKQLEREGFEQLHDELHASPLAGTIHHVHTPPPEPGPADVWDQGFW